jgi:hypothetical protein
MTGGIKLRKVRALGSHVARAAARPEFGEGKFSEEPRAGNPITNTGSDKNYSIYWVATSQGSTAKVPPCFFSMASFRFHRGMAAPPPH